MSEDTIITIVCVLLVLGAYATGYFLRNTKGMKIFKLIMTPLTWLKDVVDPNYWADKIGNRKGGVYDKARNSKLNKWSSTLTGWKWWFYQIVVCGTIFIIMECLINLIGLTMLPWG